MARGRKSVARRTPKACLYSATSRVKKRPGKTVMGSKLSRSKSSTPRRRTRGMRHHSGEYE